MLKYCVKLSLKVDSKYSAAQNFLRDIIDLTVVPFLYNFILYSFQHQYLYYPTIFNQICQSLKNSINYPNITLLTNKPDPLQVQY